MIQRFRCRRKYLLYVWLTFILTAIIYGELYIYYANAKNWLPIKCNNTAACTKLLLVADPQLIGERNEIVHFLTPFTVYDSDSYLMKTYSHAFSFVQPQVVVFLGDLMDEGSIAREVEYKRYVRRLFNIFLTGPSADVRHIWLPGDNDIGGEGTERVKPEKIKLFEQAFAQSDTLQHNHVNFFKINRLIERIPKITKKMEFYDTEKITVGLSHIPLMFMPSPFVDKVIAKMQPHVLFSAHEHKSMIVSTDALLQQDRHIVPVTRDNNDIYTFSLGVSDLYEILVPTCSYRMGTDKIGFGYAVIENNELRYAVLWSPSRFPQLVVEVTLIALTVFVVFCYLLLSICSRQRFYLQRKLKRII